MGWIFEAIHKEWIHTWKCMHDLMNLVSITVYLNTLKKCINTLKLLFLSPSLHCNSSYHWTLTLISFQEAAMSEGEAQLYQMHDTVQQLPPPHYRTLEYLIRHLAKMSTHHHVTGMNIKNLAIVWAPNLLRWVIGKSINYVILLIWHRLGSTLIEGLGCLSFHTVG